MHREDDEASAHDISDGRSRERHWIQNQQALYIRPAKSFGAKQIGYILNLKIYSIPHNNLGPKTLDVTVEKDIESPT